MEKVKRSPALTIAAIFVAMLSIIYFGSVYYSYVGSNRQKVEGDLTGFEIEKEYISTLSVSDGGSGPKFYEMQFSEGDSLFNALKALAEGSNEFTFEYKDSTSGAYIVSVNGFEPDSSKQFWKIQINGTDSPTGISDYKLRDGDTVSLFIEDIKF